MNRDVITFLQLVREVNKNLRKEWKYNISGPQFVLLRILNEKGPMRMSDISEEVGVSVSGATQLANKLVQDELITRLYDESDRRVVRITITEHGTTYFHSIAHSREKALEPYFSKLSSKELSQLMSLVEKMLN